MGDFGSSVGGLALRGGADFMTFGTAEIANSALGGKLFDGSMFSNSRQGYSLPWDQYNARLGQIADYSNKLQGATSAYATAVGNMYNTAFNQYMPQAAAAFAGRGLGVDSGAFAAELGRTAATLTSQDLVDVAHQNINTVDKVNSQYGNAWDAMFGAAVGSNKSGFDNYASNASGMGELVGKLGLGLISRGQTNGAPPTPNFYGAGNADNYGLGSDWNGGNPFAK